GRPGRSGFGFSENYKGAVDRRSKWVDRIQREIGHKLKGCVGRPVGRPSRVLLRSRWLKRRGRSTCTVVRSTGNRAPRTETEEQGKNELGSFRFCFHRMFYFFGV